ncbi:hypothetical protein GGX14DRAFT_656111, partial [Mycena pura]
MVDPSPTPSWGPPKYPLPPHRLARLANALGVATPMPAIYAPSATLSSVYTASAPASAVDHNHYRRSPTPSTATSFGFASTSKYILHVVPPPHLPHDADAFNSERTLTPPPSTASGYHTHFRRGILVPFHPTLQSQLGAIAKEYALPSTAGLVLYLVSQPRNNATSPPSDPHPSFADEEPGPRLSDEIWRHLWTRVAKSELRDEGVPLVPPPLLGLGLGVAGRSSPYLHQSSSYPLPFISTNGPGASPQALHPTPSYPFTPSPSTPSSTSDLHGGIARINTKFHGDIARINTKSAPPSSSSRSRSDADYAEAETPATSHADSLELFGLGTDALVPILAKVEFDIDRRRAAWFEPWLRSRRLNHAKRARSATYTGSGAAGEESSPDEEDRLARAHIPLPFRLNGKVRQGSPESLAAARDPSRYFPLSDSPQPMTGFGSDSDDPDLDADAGKDPLAEDPLAVVFGSDADAWADMRGARSAVRAQNPYEVQLALNADELSGSPSDEDDDADAAGTDDVAEVTELLGRPQHLGVGPGIPWTAHSPSKRRAPPTPLVLHPRVSPADVAESDSDGASDGASGSGTPPTVELEGGTILPYLDAERGSFDVTAPKASAKRGGGFYDDMDLGFEADDLDSDDPYDRRKSQLVLRAQLDEIEKNLVQFSPRKLKSEIEMEEEQTFSIGQAAHSPHLSPPGLSSPGSALSNTDVFRALSNSDVFPPTPRLPQYPDVLPEPDEDDSDPCQAAWPAVPFASLPDRDQHTPKSTSAGERSPPRLAVNGVSTAMPKRFRAGSRATVSQSSNTPSETELRKRDMAEAYPAMTPSIGSKSSLNSPLIPLSPDPFGRYPSSVAQPPDSVRSNGNGAGGGGVRMSGAYWDPPVVVPAPPEPPVQAQRNVSDPSLSERGSSRFSTDSITGNGADAGPAQKQANRTTLMSVRNIKKLWRKSQKNSVSNINTTRQISTVQENVYSPLTPPPPRPNRPSMEEMQFPDLDVPVPKTPLAGGFPTGLPTSSPPPRRPSQSQDHVPLQQSALPQPQTQPQPQFTMPPRRPSQDTSMQPPPQSRPSQERIHGALGVPPPMLRSANTAPIVAAKAWPLSRKTSLDGLHWDQESPYPTRAMRAPSISSTASRPPSSASIHHPSPAPPTPPPMPASSPPPVEKDKASARKSILKLKTAPNGVASAVPAPLTPSATSFRSRKPSLSGIVTGSPPSQGSPLVLPPDIPPSPRLPEQFVSGSSQPPRARPNSAAIIRRRLSAKMASTSTDASSSRRHRTRGSVASSSYSHGSEDMDTHESTNLDTSGFDIVSPRIGGTLAFPYTDLD